MSDSTRRGWLYAGIVLNLLLWMAVLAGAYGVGISTRGVAVAGLLMAAASQHWAYYSLWKGGRVTNE